MTSAEKARSILNVADIFLQGCGNTIVDKHPPEACDECSETFLDVVASVLAGEKFVRDPAA